jgi:hypothetical protein
VEAVVVPSTRAEGLTRIAAAVLGALYVVGLCVVTLHLARYGVSGAGLVQAQYVLTGVLAAAPLVAVVTVAAIVVALALHESRDAALPGQRPSGRFTGRPRFVLGVLGGTVGMVGLAAFFLSFVGDRFADDVTAPFSLGEVLVIAMIVLGFAFAIGWGALIVSLAPPGGRTTAPSTALGLVLAVAATLGYLGYFTSTIYPRVPAAAGGGAPTPVHIVLKSDSAPGSLTTVLRGLPFDAVCRHRLLYATPASVIIVDPRDSTNGIAISRELVAAVRAVTGRVEPCARAPA